MKAGDTALSGGEYSAAVKFYSQVRPPTGVRCWPQNRSSGMRLASWAALTCEAGAFRR